MGVRIAAVITLAALISYYHIFSILDEQFRDSLKKYITERGQKESAIFTHAERNHQEFKNVFMAAWPEQEYKNNQAQFNRLFDKKNDGTWRLHIDAFNGIKRTDGTLSRYITGFVGKNAPNTIRFQNKLLLSYELIDRYADAWTMDYANLYVSMPENVNLIYWPDIPWGMQANSNLDVNKEEWVYVANIENNPERKPAWTGLYYDQTADEWMVSLVTPVDLEGKHLINIGHDILLNTLFDRVFNDKLEGTFNFIFREDGRIIAHSELVDVLRTHRGVLHATDTNNPNLLNMVKLVITQKESIDTHSVIIEDEQSDALLAVTRISGPNWCFVTVFPKSLLASPALQTACIVSIIGIISLIVELIILFFVLKIQVLEPIYSFRQLTKSIAERCFDIINTFTNSKTYQRQDEMGELANSMVNMVSIIRHHEEEMEDLVAQRTKELNKTNQILLRESKERKKVVSLLQTIAKNVSGLQGENYFNTLTAFLAT